MPITVPVVSVYGGDDLTFPTYIIEDPDGTPVDLSSWTWTAQWRQYATSTTAVTLDVDDTDADVGEIIISATAAQTRDMRGSGVWDLQGVLSGTTKTWLVGKTTYVEDVTRA